MDAIVQENKLVNVLHPQTLSSVATGDYICMKNYQHISFIVSVGALTTGSLLQIKEAKDASATSATVIDPGHYWVSGTSPSDTMTKTSTASSATAITTANKTYTVELDGSRTPLSLSLSHHGGWIAYAMRLRMDFQNQSIWTEDQTDSAAQAAGAVWTP